MADYQLSHLTLSSRMQLAFLMLNPSRPWGQVTALSEEYGVSRKFLYGLQEKALGFIAEALLPHAAGRKAEQNLVKVDSDFVRRAIGVCMSAVPGTVRTVQTLVELLFDVHCSVGYISQTAKELGAEALRYTQGLSLPMQALAEADEIFQGRKPCLTLVDGRSFLVLSLSAQQHRDETTWGCVLLDVQQQGVQLVDVASDGARGIRSAVRETCLAIPLRPDLFHLMQDAHRVTQCLERSAYRSIETAERARRAQQEQSIPQRRRGAPLKVKVEQSQAEAEESRAIEHLDAWQWLFHEIRQAIEPINAQGQIASAKQARQTVETAVDLLRTLNNPTIQAFTGPLLEKLDDLVAPLEWLEQAVSPWRERLAPDDEALIIWTWQHRKELGLSADQVLSPQDQVVVLAFWEALSLFHRSSSLAESLHSWLRPYLQVHRCMPDWLLPLLQLLWNHHPFQRGKRQGKSPMALAGFEDAPTLSALFDRLTKTEKAIPVSAEFFKVPQKCYPIPV